MQQRRRVSPAQKHVFAALWRPRAAAATAAQRVVQTLATERGRAVAARQG